MNETKKIAQSNLSDKQRAEILDEYDAWLRHIMTGAIDGIL